MDHFITSVEGTQLEFDVGACNHHECQQKDRTIHLALGPLQIQCGIAHRASSRIRTSPRLFTEVIKPAGNQGLLKFLEPEQYIV